MTLIDHFGRVHCDLWISLTDRCNLRCTYYVSPEEIPWLLRITLLTPEELIRIVRITVGKGVEEVHLTGREPLLRPGCMGVVAATALVEPRPEIFITTGGTGLARLAEPLKRAGLARMNVSLDTLRLGRSRQPTRRNRLADVLAGIVAADAAGLHPVKLNVLQLRGISDDEAPDLPAFVMDHGYELRFIGQMPLDTRHTWRRGSVMTAAETMARLGEHFTLTSLPGRDAAPAERFLVDGGPAIIGIIALVTAPFCSARNRLRLTADGQLRNYLFATGESDLHAPIHEDVGDEELAGISHRCLLCKLPGHGISDPGLLQPQRSIDAIGGQLPIRMCGYRDGV